ncbi:DUF389 domain-containing protein [Methanobacterium sp. BAmetb5]|uniref:DUF389 domain-containing protein n=1 Tax=Methanobacterium sp. BAmetb5 TaxID=2025351 RepID=UPI000E8A3B95|nr:DUF389 domain-containing protein [Methanobacterium sp. BAmetb5]AXV39453.1 MAG: DUF389 domain-containing protein [Methanobacterium sp. BAmetb5]
MWKSIGTLIHGGTVNKTHVERIRDLVLYEGSELKNKLVKFFLLLIFSSGIATYGLLGDSVAVIIGAMIIAPLMLPIMGLAYSISAGDIKAMKNSLLLSLGGIIAAIAVGFILTLPMNSLFQPENINQILIRTSPGLIDLLAALVTGFAGAFAMSRSDVSDTLPGVAIAISLVPPLANVGILLATFNYSLALGSFLLFVTNYLAILVTGAALFGIMGYSRVTILEKSSNAKRNGLIVVLISLIVITVPLGYNGYNVVTDNSITQTVNNASTEWLEGSGYELQSINILSSNNTVVVKIIGNGPLPPIEKLQEQVKGKIYGKNIKLEVVYSDTYLLNT